MYGIPYSVHMQTLLREWAHPDRGEVATQGAVLGGRCTFADRVYIRWSPPSELRYMPAVAVFVAYRMTLSVRGEEL
jgi:hypothetical protein